MKNIKAIGLLIGLIFYSATASACLMIFNMKGVQDGVDFGECACGGKKIGIVSWKQCYDTTEKMRRQLSESQAAPQSSAGYSNFGTFSQQNFSEADAKANAAALEESKMHMKAYKEAQEAEERAKAKDKAKNKNKSNN